MKTVAVICEYNPFHNGHARQLRQMAAVGTTVCVMSGNYVQRGEPAICDKWTRARAAALCGADLVLELPVTYALRSAEGFADGGVEVLERLGCVDALCFGSETGSAERVLSPARLLRSGLSRVAQKVGEEGVETALACATKDRGGFRYEAADLLYHLLVACVAAEVPFDEVLRELASRHKGAERQ